MGQVNLWDRFWTKVRVYRDGGRCWTWRRPDPTTGYGRILVDGKTVGAHRLVYEMLIEPLPPGKQIDHLCRNRRCVNPNHMEVVTQAVNIQRGMSGAHNARKTSCPQGHRYTPENTFLNYVTGSRQCRECRRQYMRGLYRRQVEAARGN